MKRKTLSSVVWKYLDLISNGLKDRPRQLILTGIAVVIIWAILYHYITMPDWTIFIVLGTMGFFFILGVMNAVVNEDEEEEITMHDLKDIKRELKEIKDRLEKIEGRL